VECLYWQTFFLAVGKRGLPCCNFISLPFKKSTQSRFLQTHSVSWSLLQLLLVFKYPKCHVRFLHRTTTWLHWSIYMYRLASRIHYPSMLFVNFFTSVLQTECSEISAYKIQTLGNYPEESIQHKHITFMCESTRITSGDCCLEVVHPHCVWSIIRITIDSQNTTSICCCSYLFVWVTTCFGPN